ncbi:MAG: thermonuclease family protein [Bacilli bacterium]
MIKIKYKNILSLSVILLSLGIGLYNKVLKVEYNETLSNDYVTLDSCVDGDTAWFNINGERTKVRFLFVDTPESTNEIEPYGKEASTFTCDLLSNAKEIQLEYDGDKTDKYDRTLAWVWADGILVQEELAKNGYVEKFYDYGNYKYEGLMRDSLNDIYGIFEE